MGINYNDHMMTRIDSLYNRWVPCMADFYNKMVIKILDAKSENKICALLMKRDIIQNRKGENE